MFNEWTMELKAMADRIISMRQQLFDALKSRGTSFWKLLSFSTKHGLMLFPKLLTIFFLNISFVILYCNYVTHGAIVFLLFWINVAS